MRLLATAVQWIIGKGLFLTALGTAGFLLVLLRHAAVQDPSQAVQIAGVRLDPAGYWDRVAFHLGHLARGQVVPPPRGDALAVHPVLARLPELLREYAPVTLTLLAGAFVVSLILSLLLGAALSRYNRTFVRAPSWAAATLLMSLPDLLMVVALQIVVILGGRAVGRYWPVLGEPVAAWMTWEHYIVPGLALALLPVPYMARVTAAVLEDVSSQLYVRTAVAMGVGPLRVMFRHVGRNALIRIWAALPVMTGLLITAVPVVELMTDMPGIGRGMIWALTRRLGSTEVVPYQAGVFLLPLLVLFVLADAAGDAGQRLLDPRQRGTSRTATGTPAAARIRTGRRRWPAAPRSDRWAGLARAAAGLPAALVRAPARAARELRQGPKRVPGALRAGAARAAGAVRQGARALRDPVLLSGAVTILALLAVVILGPGLAPFRLDEVEAVRMEAGKVIMPPLPPGGRHPLGTDEWGVDRLTALLYATRYSVLFALGAVSLRMGMAAVLGLLAAGGWAATRLVRWLAVFFVAVPGYLVPLVMIPVVERSATGAWAMAIWTLFLIALPGFPRLAESVRRQAGEVLAQPFIDGARAAGAGSGRILFRHVLPALMPVLVTLSVLEIPAVATMTAFLNLLGAGPGGGYIDPATGEPIVFAYFDWGSLMSHPFTLLRAGEWWQWLPYAALFVTVLGFNLTGEGLRRRWLSRTGWL